MYFSVLESVGNTFRNDDEGGERNSLTTGSAITPLVWTAEEPGGLNNGNPGDETLQTSLSSPHSESLGKTIRQRKRTLWSQQLKHLQLELSRLEMEAELMKNNDLFYYKFDKRYEI